MKREALFYKKEENGLVNCLLCPHNCKLKEDQRGVCDVREVTGGKLHTLNYGAVSSIALDPIEKKPLYHYKPGSHILSVGSFGCNFSCGFCQNYSISKYTPETQVVYPDELINLMEDTKDQGNIGVAFTYNEPSIWYEYIHDTSELMKGKELDLILVSNGYINLEPLEKLLPSVSAMNIDLKAFNDDFYRRTCGGDVESVKKTIAFAASKTHVEITTLLVNGFNDSEKEVEELAKWIGKVDRSIPLHLSRYFPNYKFTEPPTPEDAIYRAYDTAKKYLNYVYLGNMAVKESNTYCPECSYLLVKRDNHSIRVFTYKTACPNCGHPINIKI